MVAWRSWASVRTAFVVLGAVFVFGSLGAACLDYAGEDLFPRCDPRTNAEAGAGAGAGAGRPTGASTDEVPVESQPDCGAPAPTTGEGSGSAL